jgi:prepilin-type N-terminal cleavage/methylation domain-containing protein
MRKMTRGFTIVELLIVVAVIGILATIALVGFSRYQADSRDSQRSAQATIIAEGLEKYYDQNGEYPGCSALTVNATTVITNILPGTEAKTLLAPQDSTDTATGNSIKCLSTDLTMSSPDQFAYIGDGSTTCSTGTSCLQFKLEYKDESTNSIVTISGHRQSSLLSSGDIIDLAASAYSFSKVNLSWSIVGGATQYNIRYSTNSGMTGPVTFTPSTTNSAQVTGLSLGTTYYFQVQPATTTSVGNWSNIAYTKTYRLDTPDGTAVPDPASPASQIKYTWTTVANAVSYTINYSLSNSFSSPTVVTNASQPYIVTGLSAGTTLYFRVQAVASGYTSGWSATAQATTRVPVPTGVAAVTNSSTQITASWSAVSVATSYNLEYANNSGFTSSTTVAVPSGTSKAVTGLNQGQIYYFRVYALVGAVSSTVSSSASATTTVDTPGAPGISAASPNATRRYDAGYWLQGAPSPTNWYYAYGSAGGSCPAGAYAVYQLYGQYDSPTTGYYSGATTNGTWYMVQPYSGYKVKFGAEMYCQGPSTNSSWSGWNYACASGDTTGQITCTF